MTQDVTTTKPSPIANGPRGGFILLATIADRGKKTTERFFTFVTDAIPNKNTRAAYYRNCCRFFA